MFALCILACVGAVIGYYTYRARFLAALSRDVPGVHASLVSRSMRYPLFAGVTFIDSLAEQFDEPGLESLLSPSARASLRGMRYCQVLLIMSAVVGVFVVLAGRT